MVAWQSIKRWFFGEKKEAVPPMLTLSQKGIDLLKELEGMRSNAYRDSAGNQTIGIGHKLTQNEISSGLIKIGNDMVDWHEGLSQEQAEILKKQDSSIVEDEIRKFVAVQLTQNQFDALVCFVFNIGISAFRKSTLLRKINEGRFREAAAEFIRWDKVTMANGKKVRLEGLTNRRQKEARLWLLAAQQMT